jgi:Caspase domain/Putative peptidoglycan binding domain/Domain of unknown function (DUF4189)
MGLNRLDREARLSWRWRNRIGAVLISGDFYVATHMACSIGEIKSVMRYCSYTMSMLLLSLVVVFPGLAEAEEGKRVALVIGNSSYVRVSTLRNPANDALLISDILRRSGFEVLSGTDLDYRGMRSKIDEFTELAYDADIATIYYAGHGLQVEGVNYFLPVDAAITHVAHLRTRAIDIDSLLRALPPDPAVGIVILDACRDNPLARSLSSISNTRSVASTGLAPVQTRSTGPGTGGILIAFATDPGAVAYDGEGPNSPYTLALAKYLTEPGLEIQSALTRVRGAVALETGGRQRPWHNASIGREIYMSDIAPNEQDELNILIPEGSEIPIAQNAEAALRLTRNDRIDVQERLRLLSFDPGPADGTFGSKTRLAISRWQQKNGLRETGYLEREQFDQILKQSEPLQAPLDRRFGAIAVVPREGVAYYGFGGGASGVLAEKEALRRCGDRRCEVVEKFGPGECAVMVLGEQQVFWNRGTALTIEGARDYLVQHCSRIDSSCRVIFQQCHG